MPYAIPFVLATWLSLAGAASAWAEADMAAPSITAPDPVHEARGTLLSATGATCVTEQTDVVLHGDATLVIYLTGTTPCYGYSRYTVTRHLTLNSPVLQVVGAEGFNFQLGQQFQILEWGGLTGRFGRLVLPPLGPDIKWDTADLYRNGTLRVASNANPYNTWQGWVVAILAAGLLGWWIDRRRRHGAPGLRNVGEAVP